MIFVFLAVYGWIIAALLFALWRYAEMRLRSALQREARYQEMLTQYAADIQPSLAALKASRMVLPMLALCLAFVGCASPTTPTIAHAPALRWDVTGPNNATTAAFGIPCGTQHEIPPFTGTPIQLPIDARTVATTWHTIGGRDVSALFTLAGEDFGLCAWGWVQ